MKSIEDLCLGERGEEETSYFWISRLSNWESGGSLTEKKSWNLLKEKWRARNEKYRIWVAFVNNIGNVNKSYLKKPETHEKICHKRGFLISLALLFVEFLHRRMSCVTSNYFSHSHIHEGTMIHEGFMKEQSICLPIVI